MFAYYGIKSFKCELLSKELFDEVPGEYSVNESQKRNLSNSSSIISITNNPRRRLKGTTDDISESMSQYNINSINEVSSEIPKKQKNTSNRRSISVVNKKSNELKSSSKRSQSNNSKTVEAGKSTQTGKSSQTAFTSKDTCSSQGTASSQTYIDADEDGYSIKQMIKFAINSEFPKRKFIIQNQPKFYTAVLNFYKCDTFFEEKPSKSEKILFTCKDSGCRYNTPFGEFTNLNKHLLTHAETRKWYMLYQENSTEIMITEDMLDFVKFFISTYQSLSVLENDYLYRLLKPSLKVDGYFYFRNSFLPRVVQLLKGEITKLLRKSVAITLIPDIWEHSREHFLGLGASIINLYYEKDLVILGVEPIEGNSAEFIKACIEKIINTYDFPKDKIKCNFF